MPGDPTRFGKLGSNSLDFIVGLGGYGALIASGLSRQFSTPIVVGAALSVAMAVAFDLLLLGVERAITPWARRGVRR